MLIMASEPSRAKQVRDIDRDQDGLRKCCEEIRAMLALTLLVNGFICL